MKKNSNDKFIRVISPASLAVALVLVFGTIYYLQFSTRKLIEKVTPSTVFIFIMFIFALVIAVLAIIEICKHGVVFSNDTITFTGIDENNTVKYSDIESIDVFKDESASFVKNFSDRQSIISFTLKNDKIITINIGLTTKGTLLKIVKEISARTDIKPPKIITNSKKNKEKEKDSNE